MIIGSLFAGVGGLDLAVEQVLGGDIAWQLDINRAACNVLSARFSGQVFCQPIEETLSMSRVDMLLAGFPCTDLAVCGKRKGLDGPKSGLYLHLIRLLPAINPSLVFIENVPELLKYRERVDRDLGQLGFKVAWRKESALNAGAPHLRQRVFVLAWKELPTPSASPVTKSTWKPAREGDALWPTPTSSNPNDGEELESWMARSRRVAAYSRPLSPPLAIAAEMVAQSVPWPTPTAGDAKASGSRSLPGSAAHSGTSLTDAVRPDRAKASTPWPTPAARDWRSGAGTTDDSHPNKVGTKCLPEVLKGRLNPTWVEALMGFRMGWTDLNSGLDSGPLRWPAGWVRQDPDAGPQYDWEPERLLYGDPVKGRPDRLKQMGNAVCPRQGALALTDLLEEARSQ